MIFVFLEILLAIGIVLVLPVIAILWVGAFTVIPLWLTIVCLSIITFASLGILIGSLINDNN